MKLLDAERKQPLVVLNLSMATLKVIFGLHNGFVIYTVIQIYNIYADVGYHIKKSQEVKPYLTLPYC